MRQFDDMPGRWLFKVVPYFIGFVFVLILAIWGVIGFGIYTGVSVASGTDWSNGIKPVIEQLWCGKPGCL